MKKSESFENVVLFENGVEIENENGDVFVVESSSMTEYVLSTPAYWKKEQYDLQYVDGKYIRILQKEYCEKRFVDISCHVWKYGYKWDLHLLECSLFNAVTKLRLKKITFDVIITKKLLYDLNIFIFKKRFLINN